MKTRAITGAIFVVIMLASMLIGAYVFTGFFLVLSTLCLLEFYKIIKTSGIRPHRNVGVMVAIVLFLSTTAYHYFQFNPEFLLLNVPLFFSIFIIELYKKSKIPFANIAYTFMGFIYITIPFAFYHALGFLMHDLYSFHLPLGFLLMLWASDTGAYLFGMKLGKHRLFERHSPKKTWEGLAGGLFTSVLVAYIISGYFVEIAMVHWLVMAVIIVCFGTLGDLVESMLKRSLDIKDSGGIMPGHGGFLDRFDGLLLSAPIVYAYLHVVLTQH